MTIFRVIGSTRDMLRRSQICQRTFSWQCDYVKSCFVSFWYEIFYCNEICCIIVGDTLSKTSYYIYIYSIMLKIDILQIIFHLKIKIFLFKYDYRRYKIWQSITSTFWLYSLMFRQLRNYFLSAFFDPLSYARCFF